MEEIRLKLYMLQHSGKEVTFSDLLLISLELAVALAEELIREKEKKP